MSTSTCRGVLIDRFSLFFSISSYFWPINHLERRLWGFWLNGKIQHLGYYVILCVVIYIMCQCKKRRARELDNEINFLQIEAASYELKVVGHRKTIRNCCLQLFTCAYFFFRYSFFCTTCCRILFLSRLTFSTSSSSSTIINNYPSTRVFLNFLCPRDKLLLL